MVLMKDLSVARSSLLCLRGRVVCDDSDLQIQSSSDHSDGGASMAECLLEGKQTPFQIRLTLGVYGGEEQQC
jgi:hypothetical protein